jgi:hypothetical protein
MISHHCSSGEEWRCVKRDDCRSMRVVISAVVRRFAFRSRRLMGPYLPKKKISWRAKSGLEPGRRNFLSPAGQALRSLGRFAVGCPLVDEARFLRISVFVSIRDRDIRGDHAVSIHSIGRVAGSYARFPSLCSASDASREQANDDPARIPSCRRIVLSMLFDHGGKAYPIRLAEDRGRAAAAGRSPSRFRSIVPAFGRAGQR